MKRFVKMLALTCVAALALAAVSAAGAQADPKFTASATGDLAGAQASNQVFKPVSSGSENVTCKKAKTSGSIVATEFTEQTVTVQYSECTANFFVSVAATVSNAEYKLTAPGGVHILNTITIHAGGVLNCDVVVDPQTPGGKAVYDNKTGKVEGTSALTTIVSTSTGKCPHGSTGTYTGNNLLERVGGGTLTWDPV